MFNLFFKAAIVFKVLLNWQLAFTLLCSVIFVAGFCLLREVLRDRVGTYFFNVQIERSCVCRSDGEMPRQGACRAAIV